VRSAWLWIVIGCSGTPQGPIAGSGSSPASPIPRDAGRSDSGSIDAGPVQLPADYTRCAKDDDCTVVALGCCDNTPVNNAHADAAKRALAASGRPYCPVKTACGPGDDGTWNGMAGECDGGHCAMIVTALQLPRTGPFALPADYGACATDADCVVVSMGCADETPVNRTHEIETRRAIKAANRPWRPPKDACGPGPQGVWNGQPGECKAGRCAIPKWPRY